MKAVKIILGIVLGLVGAFLIAAALAPTHTHVERSVVIDAPMDYVYPQVSSLVNMREWSPWVELDPNQTFTYEGEDGTVGSIYKWQGNEDVGKGEQEITSLAPDHVTTELRFIEPFESTAQASIHMEEAEGGTKVTWGFDSESPFPMNAMNLFMNMDDMLGPDFEKGMNMLKDRVEGMKNERNEFDGFTVMEVEMPKRTVVGTRSTVKFEDMATFYRENLGTAYGAVQKAEIEMAGMPMGVYFVWDEENSQTEMMAGIPIAEGSIEGMETTEVGGKCLVIDYYGDYEGSANAHMAMDKYMAWHGVEMGGPVVEEYMTDPETEPDASKWLTKVIYHVK